MNSYQCHQVLGLQDGASMKEVKAAYRNLALKHHPDKNNTDQDGKKFKIISEAYQTLRSDYKKNIGTSSNQENHQEKNSNKKYDFGSKRYSWGARDSDKTPQEDWTRYTQYAEGAYQNFWKQYEQVFWDYYEKVKSDVKTDSEPIQVEQEVPISVQVDPERCIACCSCETIAP
ncbi:MAG: DnaJ domain-containing protein, partial [Thaumarchaeota archaeon]|nr:DnaJ domain-containing protein [Nitrososphaerota archaeon]